VAAVTGSMIDVFPITTALRNLYCTVGTSKPLYSGAIPVLSSLG